jgi:ATP-binding cassette, subfamily B, multidrug efflux pump
MKSLSYLNKYFLKYRWRLLLGILFIIIGNYFGAIIPVIIGESMDILKGDKPISTGQTLFWTAISLAGFVPGRIRDPF